MTKKELQRIADEYRLAQAKAYVYRNTLLKARYTVVNTFTKTTDTWLPSDYIEGKVEKIEIFRSVKEEL